MEKQRKGKKRYTLIALLLVCVIAVGTSLAIFTDVFTLDTQTLKTGTLGIEEVSTIAFTPVGDASLTNMAPGDEFKITGSVKNSGSLNAKIRITLEETTSDGTFTLGQTVIDDTLAAGVTLDLSTKNYTVKYELGADGAANMNDQQDTAYTMNFKVEAMQDRNTTASHWDTVTIVPVTTTP